MEGVAENGLVLGHVRGGNDADKLGHGGGVCGRWDGEKTVGVLEERRRKREPIRSAFNLDDACLTGDQKAGQGKLRRRTHK